VCSGTNNAGTMSDSAVVCFPCPSHFVLYVGSSLIDSRYVPQSAQKSIPGAFYSSQLSFSPRLAAVIIP